MFAFSPSNNFDGFHNVSSLTNLLPLSFQSNFTRNNNKEIFFKETKAFNPSKSFELEILPQNSPNKMKISKNPSFSFEYNDDNSFSEILSIASTSASSSLEFLPSSPSPKAQNLQILSNDSDINGTERRIKKRRCVLKVGYKKKFKTEICKFWSENGCCKYGEECAFAHGSEEMREKVHTASNYKSRKCVQFHENDYCVYGTRCHFIHSLREDAKKNPSLSENSYANDLENLEVWCSQNDDCVCRRRINRTRLPCFAKIAICCKE